MKKIAVKYRRKFEKADLARLSSLVIADVRQAFPGVIVEVYAQEHLWADLVVDSFGYWDEPGEPVEEATLKIAERHLACGKWRALPEETESE
jgi:hypothetical protein